MRTRTLMIWICAIVLVNIAVQQCRLRTDLTEDKRYSLSQATRDLMSELTEEAEVTLYLTGPLNSGFLRLSRAAKETLEEMKVYGNLQYTFTAPEQLEETERQALQQELESQGLVPTAVYESDGRGGQSQQIVYPYARIRYKGRTQWVSLLQNRRGQSGAENLNASAEGLEYAFAEAFHVVLSPTKAKIAFIEGHGELPEQNTADIEQALSRQFDVYRGSITSDATCLEDFAALIIADPQLPFNECDKYVLDQYLMHGGRLLWCVNGIRFSDEVLTQEGYSPVLPADLHLTDMLFRYGVRVNPHLVQDIQCLPVPVDVSRDPERPQYQPMPWYYNPLLLTNYDHPVTRNLTQISAPFCSDIDFVGEDDGIQKTVLLATSDASRLAGTPAEVDLSDLNADLSQFQLAHIPIAAALEGEFSSVFTYRMRPTGVNDERSIKSKSVPTKQIIVASGAVPRNEIQQGRALPAGYDRYSRMQFGNRDFIVNALLWLTDDIGLINLRQKTIPLRLLNERRLREQLTIYQICSTLIPLCLLALTAVCVLFIRKQRYIL